jgi:hypothetical protein
MIQGSIRVNTTEDTDVPAIEDFLDKPVSLTALESGSDEFENLDEDEQMVLRVSTNAKQLIEKALGEEMKDSFQGKSRAQSIGRAMAQVESWTSFEDWNFQTRGSKGRELVVPTYPRGRGYVRRDATMTEITRGYRIIETEEENLL